eukprot:TRINITY_DN1353_c0_g1_i1.p1 TRINITY_DN1353_c0_g1~~TRINITY_DN1353_c0_g1_i1.p1  ORF type:complete len:304 (-),score=54.54 TRINITY_DN1353_c0_g1_i1:128-1039(-)
MIESELDMLSQKDREEYRIRHDRIDVLNRQKAMQKIQDATDRTSQRKQEQFQLLNERAANRKQAVIDKVEFERVTPGPGEYNIKRADVPCPKIATRLETSNERDNPGPAAYVPNTQVSLPNAGGVKMGTTKNKTALDFYIEYYSKIPSAVEYELDREMKAPSTVIAMGNVMGELEHRLKAAAGVPAPDYYSPKNPMDRGTTFGKAPLPDPCNTPQRENPGPGNYKINMESVWSAGSFPRCNTSGEKTYLEGLMLQASRTPGPGTYQVDNRSASGMGKADDMTAGDRRIVGLSLIHISEPTRPY